MKAWSLLVLLFFIFPISSIDKIAHLILVTKAYMASDSFSLTALLFSTGLIGLFGINRKL